MNTEKPSTPGQFAGAHGSATGVPSWFVVTADNPHEGGHLWGKAAMFQWPMCLRCMMIRRADRQNKPCKGPGKLRDLKSPNDDQAER